MLLKVCAILLQDWGMEICMATLLLSAFLYLNVLSLIFFLCIGAGMALPEGARRRTWAMVSPYNTSHLQPCISHIKLRPVQHSVSGMWHL